MFPPYLAGGEGAALISGAAGEHIIIARRQLLQQQAETAPREQKATRYHASWVRAWHDFQDQTQTHANFARSKLVYRIRTLQ